MTDPVLVGLLVHARDEGGVWPVTLLVAGTVVSGMLVSEERWHAEMARLFDEAPDRDVVTEQMARQFREWRAGAAIDGMERPEIEHVHLLDTQVGHPVHSVGRWRVRLDRVDGWKLGSSRPDEGQARQVIETRSAS